MLTDRDLAALVAVARYYVLNRAQIQRLCFPSDTQGRVARRRLQMLVSGHLLNRTQMQVFHPLARDSCGPVYYPSPRGAEFLAEHFDDPRYLLTATQCPQPHHLLHWLAVSETHIALDAALARQSTVSCESWLNEWDVVNKDEQSPEKRFRLYLLLRESPRLVCAPDAAFLLSSAGHRKAYYLEQDRNTSGVRQIAASKMQGYAVMADQQLHLKHFPSANVHPFSVLMIAPTARRRDALRKAMSGRAGASLWKFASSEELTQEAFLHQPIFYGCDDGPVALVKTPMPAVVADPMQAPESVKAPVPVASDRL